MDRRARAFRAVEELARARDLPQPSEVISDRWNLVVRLGQSDIIAKAAALADLAKSDPAFWVQQEVDVCRALDARGVQVQRPATEHAFAIVDDVPIGLFHEVRGEPKIAPEHEFVEALARMHQATEDLTLNSQWFAALTTHFDDVFPRLRERLPVRRASIDRLCDASHRTLASIESMNLPSGFVHGDAQRKNAMWDGQAVHWIDLEECCVGPRAWDVACFVANPQYDSQRVRQHYAELTGTPFITDSALAELLHARELQGLTWMLAIQDEREDAFRDEAENLLARVLASAD